MATEVIPTEDSKTVVISPGQNGGGGGADAMVFREDSPDGVFSQYAICGKIGDGGMGVVYLAKDRRLNRYVAIKRLNEQSRANPGLRDRFLQEARAVAALNHVNIVHIYALGEDDSGPYIIMEYVAGPDGDEVRNELPPELLKKQSERPPAKPLTLDNYVLRHGQMPADEAVRLLMRLGKAMAYAHGCGVIHRDLKPSNVLLDKEHEPKIVDFGLARLESRDSQVAVAKLTVPGEKLLSLGYSAPEQEHDASVSDGRSDVYGLGAIFYFCLTGKNPRYFREQDVAPSLREVLTKALATDREQRWSSATAFVDALYAVQTNTRIDQPIVKKTWRCKWCDTVNPVETRYCVECGWEGAESCPECSAELFVGVQYCGVCGADARAYESLQVLSERMRKAMDKRRFERVVSFAGRVHGFEPAGQNGRNLLKQIQDNKELAEQKILRRNRLIDQIPIEFKAENYERTLSFIQELRLLNEDQYVFEAELKQLPDLIFVRDFQRLQRLVRTKDWFAAQNLCAQLLADTTHDNTDCRIIEKQIERHFYLVKLRTVSSIVLLCVLAYLFALPPVIKLLPEGRLNIVGRFLFAPVKPLYKLRLLDLYATALLPPGAVQVAFEPVVQTPDVEQPVEVQPPMPPELQEKQTAFNAQLKDLEEDQRKEDATWPEQYVRELDTMLKRRQAVGDYEGWAATRAERQRFENEHTIGEISAIENADLALLKSRFRQLRSDQNLQISRRRVATAKKYINDLSEVQRRYMQNNQMEFAAAVNTEIKRVRSIPAQVAAEALLLSVESSTLADEPLAPVTVITHAPEEKVSKEIDELRSRLDMELSAIDEETDGKLQLLPAQYEEALTGLMNKYQQTGDYESWQVVSQEVQRYDVDRVLLPKDIIVNLPALTAVQKRFIKQRSDINLTRARQVVKLFDGQIAKLEDLQKKMTKDGRMDNATAANSAIKILRARQSYLEAQAEILAATAVTKENGQP